MVAKNIAVDPTTSNKYSSKFYHLIEQENHKKTDGDMVAYGKVRYLTKVKDTLTELYQKQKEIHNSSLSNEEKRVQTKTIQVLINNIQKTAVNQTKDFSEALSRFELSQDIFNDDYREATRLFFGAEMALKNYNSKTYEKAQALYNLGIDYIFFAVFTLIQKIWKATLTKQATT